MARYVALLRGVNVGGRNRLPMSELRALFVAMGFEDVATLIQSGNVAFSSDAPVQPDALAEAIARAFTLQTAVVLRTGTDLRRALEADPFADASRDEVHVGFLARAPSLELLAGLDPDPYPPDRYAVVGEELYLHLPNGMARTKLPAWLGRRLRIEATVRNWRTVTRLAELAGA